MVRLTIRTLLAHKARLAMTTLAVVMGVGFVVGSFVVTDSLRRSVDTLFTEITGGTDVSVRAKSDLDVNMTSGAGMRGRVPVSLVDQVRRIDGVQAAQPSVAGYAQLIDREGKPLKTTGAPFIGVSWGHVPALLPVTLDQGRAPDGLHEVAIDRGSAKDAGFRVGDETTVLLADGSRPKVRIVGIFTFGEANNLLGARLTAFDIDVARRVYGTGSQVDSIDVLARPGIDPATLATRIDRTLPAGVEAVQGTQIADEGRTAVSGFMDLFRNILLGFAAIALFVSVFLINNTFSIVVGQRTRELALLRSLGASPAQVTRSVIGEALTIGVLASAIGIGFGMVIATGLQAILDAAGFGLPHQGLVLGGRTLAAAVVVGLGVTLLASVLPARRASAVPPVEGMREAFVPVRGSRPRRILFGACLSAAGAALVVIGLYVSMPTMRMVLLLALGTIAAFIGVAQLSPVLAVPLAGRLGKPLAPLFRIAGRLAQANAVRNPERTAKTASALMIGLALVTTVFIVGSSMKASFASSLESSVAANYVLSTENQSGFSPAVTDRLAKLPEISAVSGVRVNKIGIDGHQRDVVAVDGRSAEELIDIDMQSGSLGDLRDGTILLHEDPARDLGLQVGDRVTVRFATGGPTVLRVAGTYSDSTYVGNYVIDMAQFRRGYPASNLDLFAFARVAPTSTFAEARRAIEPIVKAYPQIKLQDRTEFSADQQAQFDSILIAINGLLGLALFIALLGIANTLALSVLERTREIGLLRAVGMLRRQAGEMILAESAMVAVFGALLGVALGAVFGIAAAAAMPSSVITTTAIPYGTLALTVLAATICGLVAGLLPARRAGRLDVLRAIEST
jgi:putative ABC transport system permease protein